MTSSVDIFQFLIFFIKWNIVKMNNNLNSRWRGEVIREHDYPVWFSVYKLGCATNIFNIFLNQNKTQTLSHPHLNKLAEHSALVLLEVSHLPAPWPVSSPVLSKSQTSYKRIKALRRPFGQDTSLPTVYLRDKHGLFRAGSSAAAAPPLG